MQCECAYSPYSLRFNTAITAQRRYTSGPASSCTPHRKPLPCHLFTVVLGANQITIEDTLDFQGRSGLLLRKELGDDSTTCM